MGSRWTITLVLAVVLAGLACRSRSNRVALAPPAEGGRFPHGVHRQACTFCHDAGAIAAGVASPPGQRDHAPCDQSGCHRDDFLGKPNQLCRVCHSSVDPTGGVDSPLLAYPRADYWRSQPTRFSHASHLDTAAMDGAVGFHVACADCHATAETAYPENLGHAACARCHADEVALAGAPPLRECTGCHLDSRTPRRLRRLIEGDLRFDHRGHGVDARGQRIRCDTCHRASAQSTSSQDHPAPAIGACVACHDDSERVPAQRNMRACATCHTGRAESLGTLAPRSHLPATERPANHTLAFRRDHAELAGRDAARCAACHTQLSGSPQATCDECHRSMRPLDHTVGFRELDHGGEAQVSSDRCATCHVADFCSACHRRPPRSHQPLAGFRGAEHGDLARMNLRSCLTCHDPVLSCGGCHDGAGALR